MHPCDIIVVSELRPQPLLSYKVCILCLGTVTLPWRFDFLDSPWTCLSISDSSGNLWLIWSDLLFMVGMVPLPAFLSPLNPRLPLLWRPHWLPDKNTIMSWFGSSTLKENILFIQILAVFCWYTGESVMDKTELNLEFHSNGQNSLFQAQSCKAYLSHMLKATWNRTAFYQIHKWVCSWGRKVWKVAIVLYLYCCAHVWVSDKVTMCHSLHRQAGSLDFLLGYVCKQPG